MSARTKEPDIVERLRDRSKFMTCISPEMIMTEAADYIERLRAERPGWRPMEGAPKDGTRVILCGDPKRYGSPFEIGCWNEPRQSWGSFGPAGDVIAWQPLPTPPAPDKGE